jgi:hypothetical protein
MFWKITRLCDEVRSWLRLCSIIHSLLKHLQLCSLEHHTFSAEAFAALHSLLKLSSIIHSLLQLQPLQLRALQLCTLQLCSFTFSVGAFAALQLSLQALVLLEPGPA